MNKYWILFVLSSWLVGDAVHAQSRPPKYIVGPGEYQCFFINTATGKIYGISTVPSAVGAETGIPATPMLVGVPQDRRWIAAASGLHHSLVVDEHGEVWMWGAVGAGMEGNQGPGAVIEKPTRIVTDSLGNPFKGVVQVVAWSNYIGIGSGAIKSDGTVWVWGNTGGGIRGNGQFGQVNSKPVQVLMPKGKKMIRLVIGEIAIALASDGTVWTWGGYGRKDVLGTNTADFMHPHQVILPQAAKDIAGGNLFNYALGSNGTLYGWGAYSAYMGIGRKGYMADNFTINTPRDLTNDLKLPHRIASISTNSVSTHVILTDSTLWGWGDNTMGCVGNGKEIDWAAYNPPYAWNWGPGELMQQQPVRLVAGVHNFTHLFGGSAAIFYCYAETATGQLYSWGRNKAGVLGNGVMGATSAIEGKYPNSWDVTVPAKVDPFALKGYTLVNSPYCRLHPDGFPCNQYNDNVR